MLPAFGLYTHIQANRRRSIVLVVALFALVYVMNYALALLAAAQWRPEAGLVDLADAAWGWFLVSAPLSTLVLVLWVAFAARFNRAILDAVTASYPADEIEHEGLRDTLEALCISRGMAVPQLRIVETPAVNAFASGLDESQYAITVTRGLLEALEPREIEAVLAHELTHIRNEDVRLMVVAAVIAGVVGLLAELAFRWLSDRPAIVTAGASDDGRKRRGGGAAAAVALALTVIGAAWLLSQVIRFTLSRSREFLADAGAVELTKDPDAMIGALLKIQGRGELPGAPSGVMELCVDNPRSGFADLFATHPSIEARVDALQRYAGGRVPAVAGFQA